MKNSSLTVRVAMLLALLSFCILGLTGLSLYRQVKRQITLTDDAALITRVNEISVLLKHTDAIQLINQKPQLFANMLNNSGAMLTIRMSGEKPLIDINPAGVPLPDLVPVPPDVELSEDDIRRGHDANGTPFIAIAVSVRSADPSRNVEIVAGRGMADRRDFLRKCAERILIQISLAALLFAGGGYWVMRRGLLPLRRLAAQTETITVSNLDARIERAGAPKEVAPVIDAFNAMLARLATGFTQLSQVSADMAHDLRTPINNLLGQTEVALSQRRSADQYELLLASNLEELQRLSKMTDNMLFLARSENADAAIERKTLEVSNELEHVAEYFEGLAEERDLKIAVHAEGSIAADSMLLRRALANLIANAIRYADKGSVILLQSERAPDGVTLLVENRGPAIDENHLARVFDRFYRADPSRRGSSESSGLGLSIVRSIMNLHRGLVCVERARRDAIQPVFPECLTGRYTVRLSARFSDMISFQIASTK